MNTRVKELASALNDYCHFYTKKENKILQNELLKELQSHNNYLDERIDFKLKINDKIENNIPLSSYELSRLKDL